MFRMLLEPARSRVINVEQCILYARWSCALSNTAYRVVDLSGDVEANLAEWGGWLGGWGGMSGWWMAVNYITC